MELNIALYNKVISKWDNLKSRSSDIEYFLSFLDNMPNIQVGVFGGAVRDWWLDKEPKDIDIVVQAPEQVLSDLLNIFGYKKNEFGGNVIIIDNFAFDIWNLKDTFAFIDGQFAVSWNNLVASVPFNTDSVVVCTNGNVYTQKFWHSLSTKKIDFVNRKVRDPKRIAMRAILQSQKYGFSLSPELVQYCKEHVSIGERLESLGSSNKWSGVRDALTDDYYEFKFSSSN